MQDRHRHEDDDVLLLKQNATTLLTKATDSRPKKRSIPIDREKLYS